MSARHSTSPAQRYRMSNCHRRKTESTEGQGVEVHRQRGDFELSGNSVGQARIHDVSGHQRPQLEEHGGAFIGVNMPQDHRLGFMMSHRHPVRRGYGVGGWRQSVLVLPRQVQALLQTRGCYRVSEMLPPTRSVVRRRARHRMSPRSWAGPLIPQLPARHRSDRSLQSRWGHWGHTTRTWRSGGADGEVGVVVSLVEEG